MAVLRLFQTLIKRELDSGKSRKGFKGRKWKLQRVFVWGGKFGSLLRQTNKSIDLATWTSTTRGCHRRCTIKGVPKKCAKFTRKLVCPNFCFNKVVGLKQTSLGECSGRWVGGDSRSHCLNFLGLGSLDYNSSNRN